MASLRRAAWTSALRASSVAATAPFRGFCVSQISLNEAEKQREEAEAASEPAEEPAEATQEETAAAGETNVFQSQLEELKAENQALKDARLRALAELENVRRIAERDVENAREFAIQKFAKQLLDVSDNLERATDAVPEAVRSADDMSDEDAATVGRALLGGVRATGRELHKVFEMNGIHEFGEAGEHFDPECMEAMFVMPITDDLPAGTVGQVLRKGYKFKTRVLRAAQVGATPVQ